MINSLHLQTLLPLDKLPLDIELSKKMDAVRRICNATLFLRKEAKMRVRMPLNELIIYSKNELGLSNFIDIIKSELNIKNINFSLDFAKIANEKLILDLKKCGQKFSGKVPELVKAANSGQWQKNNDLIIIADETLTNDYYQIKLEMKIPNSKVCSDGETAVYLDTKITPELENEGIARDIIRIIQQIRKDINLNVSDRIMLGIETENEKIVNILNNKQLCDYIAEETLALEILQNCSKSDNIIENISDELGVIKIGIKAIKKL